MSYQVGTIRDLLLFQDFMLKKCVRSRTTTKKNGNIDKSNRKDNKKTIGDARNIERENDVLRGGCGFEWDIIM